MNSSPPERYLPVELWVRLLSPATGITRRDWCALAQVSKNAWEAARSLQTDVHVVTVVTVNTKYPGAYIYMIAVEPSNMPIREAELMRLVCNNALHAVAVFVGEGSRAVVPPWFRVKRCRFVTLEAAW
jgi:hypothetical protein